MLLTRMFTTQQLHVKWYHKSERYIHHSNPIPGRRNEQNSGVVVSHARVLVFTGISFCFNVSPLRHYEQSYKK